jgi:hypothetical protein
MVLTARELAVRLGLSAKKDYVAVAGLLKILEAQGSVKAVGKRPFLDADGKQTIGRPSVLYDVPSEVVVRVPESDPVVVAPVATVEAVAPAPVEAVAPAPVEAVVEDVADAA